MESLSPFVRADDTFELVDGECVETKLPKKSLKCKRKEHIKKFRSMTVLPTVIIHSHFR